MPRPRMQILAGGAVVVLSLALAAQIYLLYGRLGEKDRAIRLLAGEVERISAQLAPLSGALDGREDSLITLRFRLREKDKQVRLLEEEKQRRRLEFLSLEQEASKSGEELRALRERLQAAEKDLLIFRDERKKLENELRALQEARTLAEARGRELTLLKQENAKQARALEEIQGQFEAFRRRAAAQKPPADGKKPPQPPSR